MTEVVVSANATLGPAFSVTRLLSAAASTNPTLVKAGKGRVFRISLYNASATVKWLKLYDKVTAPTVGTDTPRYTYPLPATSLTNLEIVGDIGLDFQLGIGFAITGAVADADTTALVAADVVGMSVVYL